MFIFSKIGFSQIDSETEKEKRNAAKERVKSKKEITLRHEHMKN